MLGIKVAKIEQILKQYNLIPRTEQGSILETVSRELLIIANQREAVNRRATWLKSVIKENSLTTFSKKGLSTFPQQHQEIMSDFLELPSSEDEQSRVERRSLQDLYDYELFGTSNSESSDNEVEEHLAEASSSKISESDIKSKNPQANPKTEISKSKRRREKQKAKRSLNKLILQSVSSIILMFLDFKILS
jgi:hypothetical protein